MKQVKVDRRYSYRASLLVALLSSVAPVAVLANPVDGVVAAGSATISSAGTTLTINQSTDKAIIDWRGFDIAAGETTQFVQPSSGSLTLNRVGSGGASQINGNLIANGNIIIINPNGVVFGAGSKVDVNGMVATSADISNSDVMAGNLRFTQPGNPNATIENHGEITAKDAGLIGLVAPNVINSGVITAKLGRIHLASGDTATVDLYGDGLISVKASDALTSQLVKNTGTLSAQGGTIAMTAAAGRQTVDSLIHVGGTIAMTAAAGRQTVDSLIHVGGTLDARGIGTKNGKIYIYAEGSKAGMQAAKSRVVVDGKLDVSNAAGTGGKIEVLGDDIAVAPTAQINADGRDGGGIVHIGGDVQGKGPTPTALTLDMAAGALITANAMLDGNGGEVVMYADDRTVFNGRIEANGEGNGDGGFIETSGRVALLVGSGNVSATTRRGRKGEWLLDPADITITASTDANNSGGTPFTATATGSQVSALTIKGILDAGTNVTIQTSNDGYAGNGSINVASAISTTGGGSLTLSAYKDIAVNASITLAGGSLTLRADNADFGEGSITIGGTITTNGGNVTIGGGSGAISAGAGYAKGHSGSVHGVYASSSILAGGGNIVINGIGYNGSTSNNYGVQIGAAASTTGTGTININGTGQGNTNSGGDMGVTISGVISTVNGALNITGVGGGAGSGSGNYGVYTLGSGSIRTTGSGAISVTGTGGNASGTAGSNHGVYITNANGIQTTGGGAITVNGTGSNSSGSFNYGVSVTGGSIVGSGGAINITGTGGLGNGNNNHGVVVNSSSTVSNTGSGNITVTGTGRGASNSSDDYGVIISGGSTVSVVDGALSVTGTGGGAGSGANNYGVVFSSTGGYARATGTGSVSVTGQGGNTTGNGNQGVLVNYLNAIQTNSGAITVNGTGSGTAGTNSYGVIVGSSVAGSITSTSGNISITGQGAASSGNTQYGVYIGGFTGSSVSTGSSGTLTITGTGGGITNSGSNTGVVINNSATATTVNGALSVTGNGGGAGSGTGNGGVLATGGGVFRSSGSGAVTVTGTGGNASGTGNQNIGVSFISSSGVQSTGSGNITITGTAGGGVSTTGNGNHGVETGASAVSSTGTGTITITGTAGYSSGDFSYGVVANGANAITSTGSGTSSISITGNAGNGTGQDNDGIVVTGSIAATGNNTITLNGTGGGSSNSTATRGIYIASGGSVSTVNGTLTVTGTGGGAGSGVNNFGVYVTGTNSTIKTTGSGNLSITGTGGNSGGSGGTNHGIYVAVANGIQTTGTGNITLSGTKGGQATSYGFNTNVANGVIASGSAGNITVRADTMLLNTAGNINAVGSLTLAPLTAITMGVGSGSGALSFTDTYIGYTTAASYIFGSTTASDLTINTSVDFVNKNVSFLSGGNISLAGTLTKATGAGTATYLLQANGNISNSSSAGIAATTGAINLTMTSDNDVSGAGSITLTSAPLTVNGGTITLNSNGQSVTQSGSIGGDETINSSNGAVSIGTLDGDTAGTRSLTVNAGTATFTTTAAIGATNKLNNLTVVSNDVALGANIGGTGTLTLEPNATASEVRLNDATAGGTYTLTTTEMGYFVDGWSGIIIGKTTGSGSIYMGATSWSDPITFRNNYRTQMNSNLTASGNASVTFTVGSSGWINAYGNITTAGQNVAFNGVGALTVVNNITTSGGAISAASAMINAGVASPTWSTSNGNISISGTITRNTSGGSAASRTFTLNAGTGTIAFGSTVNGDYSLTATGASITTNGAWGGSEGLGDIAFTSTNSISLPAITTAAGKTVAVSVTGTGNSITTTGAIATGTSGNITLTANDMALGANLSGTGTLTLQPTSTNRSIRLNNGSSDGTNLNLTTTEIGYFVNGWSGILIGAATGHTDYINIGATTWNDPVSFRGYYSRVYGNIAGQDNASVSFTGSGIEFHSSSSITTQGYGINFSNGYVLYVANTSLDSNGGNIAISNRITANLANIGTHTVTSDNGTISIGNGTNAIQAGSVTSGSYSFNAGTGSLTFSGAVNTAANVTATAATITTASAWGASTGLGDVTLTSTNNLSLPAITTAAGKTVAVSVTGAGNRITTTGAIATGVSGNITLSADDMTLGANLSGTGTLTVQPTSNNRLTYINYGASDGTNLNLTTTEIGYFVDGWSGIAIGKSSGSTAYMDVGATNWNDPVTFRGWYTRMRGTIAGLGNASLSFIGTGLEFITSSALLTTQGQAINLGTSTLDYSVYGTNMGIDSNGGAITINGRPLSQVGAFQNFTINSDGGNISMGGIRQATTVTNGSYIIDAGAGSLAFTSIVNTGANVTATAGSMTFSSIWGGTVTLGTASLTSSSALALPEIHATTLNINNSGAVTQTGYLALTNLSMAGAGSYTLNHASNNVGTIAANTSNTINFSNGNNGFTVGSVNSINGITTTGNNVTLSAGTGTLTTTQAIAVGAANLSLSADDMALGANLSGTGTLTVQPTSTNRPTYINYGASDGTNLNLTTTEIGYFVNGWSGINIGRTDAVAAGITNLGASSWNDPVSLRAYKNYLYGAVAGLGNASFGFSGVSDITELGTSGSLSTQNAAITMGELNISGTNNSIASNGGAITIAKIKDTGAAIGTLSVTSSNGAIAIGDATNAIQSNGATSGTYSFNAGTNSVTFSGNVNTALGVTANGNSIVTGSGVWGGSTALGAVSLTSATTLALPTITASSIFAQTTGATADISIASGKTLTASGTGSAITLVAKRNFLNSAATPFSLTGGGRFLVYSTNPTDSVLNGRASNFVRYSCTYGGTCPTFAAETGNGFLYTYTPTLTITPTAINLNYNDPVPSLTAYAYGVSGYLTSAAGNDATLDVRGSSINGTTNYTQGSSAGNYTINYSNGTLTSAQGYGFSYANNAAGIVVTGSGGGGGGGGGNNTNSSTVPSTVTHSSQLPYMGEEMIWWWDDRAVEGEAENDAEEKIAATPEEEQRRKQSQQIGLPSFIELSPALQARLGIDI